MSLKNELRALIQTNGPLSIARFMAEALGHPKYGYYMKQDPFGASGDFITAPEISQMFGEMIGLWLIDCWQKMGAPTPVQLIELGPGRGTLMSDILRAVELMPPLRDALEVHFIETSPVLRDAQKQKVPNAQWHDRLDDIDDGFSFIIANEFFDALPIRQLEKRGASWHERFVLWNEKTDGFFPFSDKSSLDLSAFVPEPLRDANEGAIFEFSPASQAITQSICGRLNISGGLALFIDYGHSQQGIGETLQALKDHEFTDIFSEPGNADLTAHVDFQALAHIAHESGCVSYGPTTQGHFLKSLGIETRAQKLSQTASEKQALDIKQALHRLISDKEMGELFKVLAIVPKDTTGLVGF